MSLVMGLVNLVSIPAESDDIVTQVDGSHFSRLAWPTMQPSPQHAHAGTSRRCVLRTSTGSSRIASWFLSPVPSWWTQMNKMMCDLFKWRPEKKNVAVPPDPLLKF